MAKHLNCGANSYGMADFTAKPKYKFEQDSKAEFYYSLLLPDPDNKACHIFHRPTGELWAFTDSQGKAKKITDALNRAAGAQ